MKVKYTLIVLLLGIITITGCGTIQNSKEFSDLMTSSSEGINTSSDNIISSEYEPTSSNKSSSYEHSGSVPSSGNEASSPPEPSNSKKDTSKLEDIFDLSNAVVNIDGYARFDNISAARRTTGDYFVTNDPDKFDERFSDTIMDKALMPESLKSGQELNESKLMVSFARCELFSNYSSINNQALYLSGGIKLSGVLRHRKSDEGLVELGQKGDLLFYPFPQSIYNIPLILFGQSAPSCYIFDDNNDFYMISDTVQLYLGNTESKRVYTKIDVFREQDGLPDLEISYNDLIENFLDDAEYYYAEFEFSDLYLLSYQDRMTGEPYSSGIITEICSVTPLNYK